MLYQTNSTLWKWVLDNFYKDARKTGGCRNVVLQKNPSHLIYTACHQRTRPWKNVGGKIANKDDKSITDEVFWSHYEEQRSREHDYNREDWRQKKSRKAKTDVHQELEQLDRHQWSGTDKSGTGPTAMESHNLRSLEQTGNLKKKITRLYLIAWGDGKLTENVCMYVYPFI